MLHNLTPLALLEAARAWLLEPSHWTQGQYIVRDAEGSPRATCLAGGVYLAAGCILSRHPVVLDALGYLDRLVDGALEAWNDDPDRTHTDVVARLDQAIEIARRAL